MSFAEASSPGHPAARPVLVTGGTGTLGRHVVRRLMAAGHPVRVMSRRPRPAGDAEPYEWVTCDLAKGDGLEAAVAGAGAIVHCATMLGRKDVAATRRLTEAAAAAPDRPHLVHISIVGVDRVPMPYYRAKLESERVIEESGLPWTILRATQFHDLIVRLTTFQRWLPVTVAFSGVRFQPVDAAEVAARLADLATAGPAGRVADMGGPQVRTAGELTAATLRAYGRRRPVVPVRIPGRTFRGYREGEHLTPEHAVGTVTFEEHLRTVTAGG